MSEITLAAIAKTMEAVLKQELDPIKATLAEHTWWVTAVAWSPDGARLATGSGDRTVAVWQLTAQN